MNTRLKVAVFVVCVLVSAAVIQVPHRLRNNKSLPYESVAEIHHVNGPVCEFEFDSLPTTVTSADLAITLESGNSEEVIACDVDVSGLTRRRVKFDGRSVGDRFITFGTTELPTSILAKSIVKGTVTFASPLEHASVRVRIFGWTEAKNRRLSPPPPPPPVQ